MTAAIYVALLLAAAFALSGLAGDSRSDSKRIKLLREFRSRYAAFVEDGGSSAQDRTWLIERRQRAQAAAMAVGLGTMWVAPPPMIGGDFRLFQMFSDLFSDSSFTDSITPDIRIDNLHEAIHLLEERHADQRRQLVNPLAWLTRAFRRVVKWPVEILKTAGFTSADASIVGKTLSAFWAFAVGAAAIGGFVLTLTSGSGG